MGDHIDIVFDGPPEQQMPRLVEVEDANGRSFSIGEWGRAPRRPLGSQDLPGRAYCPISSGCSVSVEPDFLTPLGRPAKLFATPGFQGFLRPGSADWPLL